MAGFVQQPCDEAVIRSGGVATPCAKSSERWILAATILGSSMAFVDGTVVNVALRSLDRRLTGIDIPASVRHSFDNQRINLAAAAIPEQIVPPARAAIRQAIRESFVDGFRRIMLVGAVLALAGGIISWMFITRRTKSAQQLRQS